MVKRIAGERSWTEVAGILSEAEGDELESLVEERRSRSRDRREQIDADVPDVE
nr:hypothetical protein [Halorubrum sp. 48-1-W]